MVLASAISNGPRGRCNLGSWPLHTAARTSLLLYLVRSVYCSQLFSTPLGQAIGIATHTLYSPDSEVGLLVVGIMNAISAGLLVFASLIELMSEDFLSDESWVILRGNRRIYACILVFMGAFLMSLVGAWA